jgi:uncharacterized damage-inducible protein DinB
VIDKGYVLQMARYNTWQNKQIMDVVKVMDEEALHQDRGAFFKSIMGTLNHILWGDTIWMSRWCDDIKKPVQAIGKSVKFTPTLGVWQAERFRMDGRIRIWAQTLSNLDLTGHLSWFSGALEQDVTRPLEVCVIHMFNHQTHHRGQVHAMLTAAGHPAPTSDLFVLPEAF